MENQNSFNILLIQFTSNQFPTKVSRIFRYLMKIFNRIQKNFTSALTPASSNLIFSFCDLTLQTENNKLKTENQKIYIFQYHCDRIWRRRGKTRVSSPHRMSGCASSKTLAKVVPDLGIPPMNIIGSIRSQLYVCLLSASTTMCCNRGCFW